MPKNKTANQPSPTDIQLKTVEENWKRALADYQNLVRRVEQDKKDYVKLANVNLISELIPALDTIELAAVHSQDIGVQMAASQLSETLTAFGVIQIIPSLGDKFDPKIHDCAEIVPVNSSNQPDTVAEMLIKGYKLFDYIIRPAKVKVFK